jgi:hypothetical protein
LANRAADAMPPKPPPTTTTRAMPGTYREGTSSAPNQGPGGTHDPDTPGLQFFSDA